MNRRQIETAAAPFAIESSLLDSRDRPSLFGLTSTVWPAFTVILSAPASDMGSLPQPVISTHPEAVKTQSTPTTTDILHDRWSLAKNDPHTILLLGTHKVYLEDYPLPLGRSGRSEVPDFLLSRGKSGIAGSPAVQGWCPWSIVMEKPPDRA